MKQKIKEAWYFVHWLIKDIKLVNVMSLIVLFASWSIWALPDQYALPVAVFVIIYAIGLFLYLVVYKTLQYQYGKYKDEQREIFNNIKDSK